ncbi:ABC transporter permease subunit [Salinibacterium sp. NSLL150]|uniref:ABC transporter permease subunit n=1 Tax=unclassified Salinibacterium TaxID=2632331 RepID=UPI0018CDECC5|nr:MULTISPECIES: ABC transporter permease subunit [unclassified Salinibacterium]MBH0099211.1 ABC transporter permease subunit [Salinibacterium sp. NSLL35]MBH0101965.1 ABC transporter permease subunit [Salinibacterium sp. NSLL150]MBH0104725.1 ABC transporter permease subunit [Salinibacterium sp. NSLL16]MBH0107485.1 ABC transporter permease subunit [Salinibacterium sp. NSLL17]
MFLLPVVLATVRVLFVPLIVGTDLNTDGTSILFESISVGALPLAVLSATLGLIAITSEYTDDSLAASLAAVPSRVMLIVAKTVPSIGLSAISAAVGTAVAGWIASITLTSRGYTVPGLDRSAELLISVVAGAACFAVLGVAFGALARSAVSAAIFFVGIIVLMPSTLFYLGGSWVPRFAELLPASALQALTTRAPAEPFVLEGTSASALEPSIGFAVLASGSALLLAAAAVIFARRSVHLEVARNGRQSQASRPAMRVESPARGLSFTGVVRSEALKALTLPSSRWLLALSAGAIVFMAWRWAVARNPADILEAPITAWDLASLTFYDQMTVISGGLALSQFLIAAFGALVATSDFATGNIRPALAAVPRRGWLLAAKTGIAVTSAMAVGAIALLLAAIVATPIQQDQGFPATLSASIVWISIAKGTIALGLVAALGCGVGMIARSASGALFALATIFVVVSTLTSQMERITVDTPLVWLTNIGRVFPSGRDAAETLGPNTFQPWFQYGNTLQLPPGASMVALFLWAAGSLAIAWVLFRRRGV